MIEDKLQQVAGSLLSYGFLLNSFMRSADAKVVADAEKIIAVSEEVAAIFGYHPSEIIGQPVEALLPDSLREIHKQHRTGYNRHPKNRPMGAGAILRGRHKNGREFQVIVNLNRYIDTSGLLVEATIRVVEETTQDGT